MKLITSSLLAITLAAAPLARADAPTGQVVQDNVVVEEKTETAIRGALKYLSAKQTPNGSWNAGGNEHPIAITAYTLIAFLSTGNLPGEGEYGKNVTRGVQYLLDSQRPDGYFNGSVAGQYMYGHGIATIALAEVYGQSRDAKLKPKLEAAVKLILNSQNPQGGWRYQPHPADADISVTVLQVVALRAAKNSGIDVPQTTIDNAVKFVKSCYDEKTGGFCYQPHQQPGFARTAAAIYSLQVCGRYDDPMVFKGSTYIQEKAKAGGDNGGRGDQWFTYGNFYAAPAEYMIGGDSWKDFYVGMNKKLMDKVKHEGDYYYWEPLDYKVGNIYATAVYTMILAMPYHYLPLYQR